MNSYNDIDKIETIEIWGRGYFIQGAGHWALLVLGSPSPLTLSKGPGYCINISGPEGFRDTETLNKKKGLHINCIMVLSTK